MYVEHVLLSFPPYTHPLTLASDPDGVLDDEELRVALAERGFRLIVEPDPIALRYAVQHAQPWSAGMPLIVAGPQPLECFPYDLWQQARHVILALHALFPRLAYPVVQSLSSRQRRRLAEVEPAHPPADDRAPLSHESTQRYVLRTVFGITTSPAPQPAQLIAWLDEYHALGDPMPAPLQAVLLQALARQPGLEGWPLAEMIASGPSYRRWVRDAWQRAAQPGIREQGEGYAVAPIAFAVDPSLQAIVPRLLRSGTLEPLVDAPASELPAWAQPGIAHRDEQRALDELAAGLRTLERQLLEASPDWQGWQEIARLWARLCVLRYDPVFRHPFEQLWRFKQVQAPLDDRFAAWLEMEYTRLATLRLPVPHHLHHVPGSLAYRLQQGTGLRPALLIMDGMSLAAWQIVRGAWQARHPHWQIDEMLVLAQVPSVTAVSRQALISGLRPQQFAGTLLHNREEAKAWRAFWQAQGLPADAAAFAVLPGEAGAPYPDAITSPRTQALCLISPAVDEMVHGATQGLAGVHAALRTWLQADEVDQQRATWIEGLIDALLGKGYTVTLTSDHGHVAGEGIGQPREGVVAVSRGKRARIYGSQELARLVAAQFPQTVLWHGDGLLPASTFVLMPRGRGAFAPANESVVTHGGLSVEELVVPLVTIGRG